MEAESSYGGEFWGMPGDVVMVPSTMRAQVAMFMALVYNVAPVVQGHVGCGRWARLEERGESVYAVLT